MTIHSNGLERVITHFKKEYDCEVTIKTGGGKSFVSVRHANGTENASILWDIGDTEEVNRDRWRYLDVSMQRLYSHPTQAGALGMILKAIGAGKDFPLRPANERLDEQDQKFRQEAELSRQLRETPQGTMSGDVLRYPDGTLTRVTHDWGESGAQDGDHFNSGSYCLNKQGSMSYSGGLNPCIERHRIKPTDERMEAPCWFFHHDHMTAHNGVQALLSVRIWEVED